MEIVSTTRINPPIRQESQPYPDSSPSSCGPFSAERSPSEGKSLSSQTASSGNGTTIRCSPAQPARQPRPRHQPGHQEPRHLLGTRQTPRPRSPARVPPAGTRPRRPRPQHLHARSHRPRRPLSRRGVAQGPQSLGRMFDRSGPQFQQDHRHRQRQPRPDATPLAKRHRPRRLPMPQLDPINIMIDPDLLRRTADHYLGVTTGTTVMAL